MSDKVANFSEYLENLKKFSDDASVKWVMAWTENIVS